MKKKSLKLILSFSFIVLVICFYWTYNKVTVTEKSSSISKTDSIRQTTAADRNTPGSGKGLKKYSVKSGSVKAPADNVTAILNRCLAFRKQPTAEAVNILSEYLNHADSVVAKEAIDTLGAIGLESGLHELVYNILAQKAIDREYTFRRHALLTAAMLGKDKALPIVSEYISENNQDADSNGYDYAVRSLGLISSPACLPYLDALLNNAGDQKIRRNCFETLAKIATPEAIGTIEKHLLSSNVKDQASSALALTRLNSPEYNLILAAGIKKQTFQDDTVKIILRSKAAPGIVNLMLEDNSIEPESRAAFLKTISTDLRYAPLKVREEVSSSVASLLSGGKETKDVKIAAIKTIYKLGGPETAQALIPELEDEDADIRREAALAFTGYANPENYTSLFDLLWDDDEKTRRVAMFTIQRFITNADRSILEKAADHKDEYIRKHAKQLLDSIS